MTALQVTVHDFFTSSTGVKGLQNAILRWQFEQGYISDSITLNWMAIAQDVGVKYKGDLYMQNNVALGKIIVPPLP